MTSSFKKINNKTYEYVDGCYGRITFELTALNQGRFTISNQYVFTKNTLKEVASMLNTLSKEVFGD